MEKIIKKFMKYFIIGGAKVLAKTRLGRYGIDQFLNSAMSAHQVIRHGEVELALVGDEASHDADTEGGATGDDEAGDDGGGQQEVEHH